MALVGAGYATAATASGALILALLAAGRVDLLDYRLIAAVNVLGVTLLLGGKILWHTDGFWLWKGLRASATAASRSRTSLRVATAAWIIVAAVVLTANGSTPAELPDPAPGSQVAALFAALTILVGWWIGAVSLFGFEVLTRRPPDWWRPSPMATTTVYVLLLEEGVDVYRPTQALRQSDGSYKLLPTEKYDPTDETWEFLPGQSVRCEARRLHFGKRLVAVELA